MTLKVEGPVHQGQGILESHESLLIYVGHSITFNAFGI